jgi:hypothetical protein
MYEQNVNSLSARRRTVNACDAIQQDAHALDETSKQNLKRHLQKFVKAARTSSAKVILKDDDQIQFLITVNEDKVRRATKSLVLGKAKVMSYEDLEEARAKRVVKESTQAAKGKENVVGSAKVVRPR